MSKLAVIGGTGLTDLPGLTITDRKVVYTPYGEPSAPFSFGNFADKELVFLPRHGHQHQFPPHKINYRANIWALKEIGVETILAITAVGGITEKMSPATIAIPDQIIDYTYDREHTFFTGQPYSQVKHIDFTYPYCDSLRSLVLQAAKKADVEIVSTGVYGATQGPRLETGAEIKKLAKDGCDIVGMTGMPEASLAKELELCYAACSVVANWGAGIYSKEITMQEIEANVAKGMEKVKILLTHLLVLL